MTTRTHFQRAQVARVSSAVASVYLLNETCVVFTMAMPPVKEVRVWNGKATAVMYEKDTNDQPIVHELCSADIGCAALMVRGASMRDDMLAKAQAALNASGFGEAAEDVQQRRHLELLDMELESALREARQSPNATESRRKLWRVIYGGTPGNLGRPNFVWRNAQGQWTGFRQADSIFRTGVIPACRAMIKRRGRWVATPDYLCQEYRCWNRKPVRQQMDWCWARRHVWFPYKWKPSHGPRQQQAQQRRGFYGRWFKGAYQEFCLKHQKCCAVYHFWGRRGYKINGYTYFRNGQWVYRGRLSNWQPGAVSNHNRRFRPPTYYINYGSPAPGTEVRAMVGYGWRADGRKQMFDNMFPRQPIARMPTAFSFGKALTGTES